MTPYLKFKHFARKQVDRSIDVLASTLRTVTGMRWPSQLSVTMLEQSLALSSSVTVRGKTLKYQTIGRLPLYRVETLFSKEPETVKWLETLGSGDVLFDVGANVGMYSLYAAACGAKVRSFEPLFTNYFILNSNINLNGLSHQVQAYCIAISDERRVDSMRLSSLGLGAAYSTFGENTTNEAQGSFEPVFEQGAFSWTLDDFVYSQGMECPTHIKVDVDGLEGKVIAGAKRVLQDPRLKSVLIELNHDLPSDQEATALVLASGFVVSPHTGGDIHFRGMRYSNMIFERPGAAGAR